ncbi:ATP-binding protein [Ferviditalea candida]|uniref:ATP-binding protein n=1 Tax=Ferviditalea candida TaxID=3108399 RepID=A0ABU5ZNH3_9BACL|nr:ATP-binding protein [Paenibacillaceae bacterium T2]
MTKFSAMARLLSHLGDQLISSSTVAILELIKNAYDAGSPSVKIIIDQENRTITIEDKGSGMSRDDILNKYLVIGTTDRLEKKERISRRQAKRSIDYIHDQKEDDYDDENNKIPLGEKGLGRFATMKLGEKLVLLTRSKEKTNLTFRRLPGKKVRYSQKKLGFLRSQERINWNFHHIPGTTARLSRKKDASLLMINWNKFNYSSKNKLDDVTVHLFKINPNDIPSNYGESFVKIKIYHIKDFYDPEEWNKKKFEAFYRQNFMKYINPFKPSQGFQITLEIRTINKDFYRYTPESIDKKLLEQAPYKISGEVVGLNLNAHYYIRGKDGREYSDVLNKKISELEGRLLSPDDQVGPISFEFYFFNRTSKRLKEIKGYEDETEKTRLLNQYSGGIMIYRDNFRVLPYAEPGNDWLYNS